MKENKNTKCDPCERDFEHKIHELVREGTAPSHEARTKREHEIKSIFEAQHATEHDPGHPAEPRTPVAVHGVKTKK